MSPTLHVRLLEDFGLVYRGQQVTSVDTPRLQSLLAYLVLHREAPQSRQYLSFRFWPDSTEKQARTNLRQLLHHLRNALPDADRFVHADTQTLHWKPDAPFTLDVAAFERAVNQAEDAEQRTEQVAALEEAVEVYRGDLLPSCYDEWIEPERERLRQRCIAALDQLVQGLEERRAYRKAIRYARRLLQKDELREATYRCLMRLHALNDDRARALRVYHACASVLEREFGVTPSPATREIHERLLTVPNETDDQSAERSPFLSAEMPLVGRRDEWRRLRDAWDTAVGGTAHFALIEGEAGIGKTRLAEEMLIWVGRQGMTTAQTRCYAAEGRLAYAPVTDWLRTEPFRRALPNLDAVWLTEVARIFPELLVDRPDLPRPEPLAERWQRQHFFEALARTVRAVEQPLLLVVDDLQWCDQDTLEWLRYLMRFASGSQLLLVGTAREEEVPADHPLEALRVDLHRTEQVTEIHLGPLDVEETSSLAAHVSGVEFEHGLATDLYRETEGNPLFVVESVRARLTERDRSSEHRSSAALVESSSMFKAGVLPPKVQAVIVARLAQLSPQARTLTDVAAVIGRAFTVEVLVEAGDAGEEEVV